MNTVLRSSLLRGACWLSISVVCAGCSGRPARVTPPAWDPQAISAAAIAECDRNGDQRIGRDEALAAPGLAAAWARFDRDGDDAISTQELAAGFEAWGDESMGMRQLEFAVELDGRRLPGAKVRLDPEPCLGGAIGAAEGEADARGVGTLSTTAGRLPEAVRRLRVVQPGLYRVRITHPTKSIAARYNTSTELGFEVSATSPGPGPVTWQVRAR
jgi:hypothetical protein